MRSTFSTSKCIAGLVAGIALAVPALQAAAESTLVTEGSKAASLESCVAPTQEIRRYHMDYLVHERDEVVIEGDRTGKFSLAECVECHAAKDDAGGYKPVNAEGQFCETCHDYTAVNLDCFQCHRTTPAAENYAIGSAKLDRLNHQLNATGYPASHQSLDLYAHEPDERQRD